MTAGGLPEQFRAFADALEALERAECDLLDVTLAEDAWRADEPLAADVSLRVSFPGVASAPEGVTFEVRDVEVGPDGSVDVGCRADFAFVATGEDAVESDVRAGGRDADGDRVGRSGEASDEGGRAEETAAAEGSETVERTDFTRGGGAVDVGRPADLTAAPGSRVDSNGGGDGPVEANGGDATVASNGDDGSVAGSGEPADRPDEEGDVAVSGDGDAGQAEAGTASSIPAYRDPEQLRAVYAEHDTFAAMTEALGVDVTPQTVRRYMVEFGIHEPRTRASDVLAAEGERAAGEDEADAGDDDGDRVERAADDADGDEAGPAPEGDGAEGEERDGPEGEKLEGPEGNDDLGPDDGPGSSANGRRSATSDVLDDALGEAVDLPSGVTLDDVKRAVKTARTLHEVARQLDVDRDRARRALLALDLLPLVTGRVVDADRPVTDEEIEARIRAAVGETPGAKP